MERAVYVTSIVVLGFGMYYMGIIKSQKGIQKQKVESVDTYNL